MHFELYVCVSIVHVDCPQRERNTEIIYTTYMDREIEREIELFDD